MPDLLEFINAHYSAGPFSMAAELPTSAQRKAYCVKTPGESYVVKLTDPGRSETVVRVDVGTPLYLCAQGFPAPRPLTASERHLLPDAVCLSFLAYMVNWDGGKLLLDNYRRMKLFEK